jgi:predicted RNA-binding Zn-ribbon protein involved in translation (DUF1610 family)
MSLFKKTPPKACPKCGRADGWHITRIEAPTTPTDGFYHASGATMRGPFGVQPGTSSKPPKNRYQCDNCGFEKSY